MRLFSSVQSFERLGRRGDMKDDSAELLFQSLLQEAIVSSTGIRQECPLSDAVHPSFAVDWAYNIVNQSILLVV